jgi:hypothetical protein
VGKAKVSGLLLFINKRIELYFCMDLGKMKEQT